MFLFIDTTDPNNSVIGLLRPDGTFVERREWEGRQNQSEELLTFVERLLEDRDVRKKELQKIVAISGPGSYTGLRVGLATANGLALALDIPIIGISSEEWIAGDTKRILQANPGSPAKAFYAHPPHITISKRDRHENQNPVK